MGFLSHCFLLFYRVINFKCVTPVNFYGRAIFVNHFWYICHIRIIEIKTVRK